MNDINHMLKEYNSKSWFANYRSFVKSFLRVLKTVLRWNERSHTLVVKYKWVMYILCR